MNAGKAIYYLLANNAGVSAITTRIYPEYAPQDADAPFIVYRLTSVDPDDTHDGPAVIDEVRIEVICVSDSYDQAADMGSVARVALDRVYGTYNTVNVESIQFDDVAVSVRDQPRQYAQELTFIVRVKRDDVQIATGSPIEDITLGRLADVTINDPIDRQTLAYDEASGEWINDGAGSISIPVFNNSNDDIVPGRPLSAVGAQGDRISVEPYQTAYGPLRFVGIAGETIPGRSNGHATVYGEVRGLDTSNFSVGALLYPIEGVNETFYPFGLFSWVESTNSNPLVCAIVTRQQQNTGRIFVRMWSPGYRNNLDRLDDVVISNPYQGALLRYDSTSSDWRTPPQTSKTILEGATETVEIYYYSITTDTQQFRTAQSDTPSAGNKIVRKIWYSTTAQADIDSGSWTLLETLADNATYADLVDAFENQLKTSPGGDTPVSIKTTWQEVEEFDGLLDTYTGAAAAYSLRRLSATYTGSAIRVRRASDNAEQDIGFDGNGDLDTTALATFCSGTDGFVKVWYDQAGANDATQTTTSAQPKIYDSATGVVTDNGKPALDFDGSDNFYATGVSLANSLDAFFVSHKNSTARQTYYAFDATTNTNFVRQEAGDPSIIYAQFTEWGGATSFLIITSQANNQNQILVNNFSESGSQGYQINGSSIGTDTDVYTPTAPMTGLYIAVQNNGANNLIGTMQEFVLFPSVQSSTNRAGIESNINDYYNIYTP
jgi:hypothetical protein